MRYDWVIAIMDSEKQYPENESNWGDMKSPALHKTTTDDERLAELGHVQELKRTFSVLSLTCLCLCLMATWEALGSVLALALISGGAPCLFYN